MRGRILCKSELSAHDGQLQVHIQRGPAEIHSPYGYEHPAANSIIPPP
jgi:hypothetical protein